MRAEGSVGFLDEFPTEDAAGSFDGADEATGEPGGHGQFVVEQMTAGFADDFFARLGEELDGDGVAHGAGGDEEGGFFAADVGGASF